MQNTPQLPCELPIQHRKFLEANPWCVWEFFPLYKLTNLADLTSGSQHWWSVDGTHAWLCMWPMYDLTNSVKTNQCWGIFLMLTFPPTSLGWILGPVLLASHNNNPKKNMHSAIGFFFGMTKYNDKRIGRRILPCSVPTLVCWRREECKTHCHTSHHIQYLAWDITSWYIKSDQLAEGYRSGFCGWDFELWEIRIVCIQDCKQYSCLFTIVTHSPDNPLEHTKLQNAMVGGASSRTWGISMKLKLSTLQGIWKFG